MLILSLVCIPVITEEVQRFSGLVIFTLSFVEHLFGFYSFKKVISICFTDFELFIYFYSNKDFFQFVPYFFTFIIMASSMIRSYQHYGS